MTGWQRRNRRRDLAATEGGEVQKTPAPLFAPTHGWTDHGAARLGTAGRLHLGWLVPLWEGDLPEFWAGVAIGGWLRLSPANTTKGTSRGTTARTGWDDRGQHRYPYVRLRRLPAARLALPSLAEGQPCWIARRAVGSLLWIGEIDLENLAARQVAS